MASRVPYQNINPEVTRKPRRVSRSPDAESDLISMQNKISCVTYLFPAGDLTVSCDLAFFRVDSYNYVYYICDIM